MVWKVNKVLDFANSGLCAEFKTLWEDQRDMMSDSVRPEMGVSGREKNRKVVIRDGETSLFCVETTAEDGNRLYVDILEMSRMWNPFKQRAAVEEWAANGGAFAEGKLAWVRDGQRH